MVNKKTIAIKSEEYFLLNIADTIRGRLTPEEMQLFVLASNDVNADFLVMFLKGTDRDSIELWQTVRTLEQSHKRDALGTCKCIEEIRTIAEILKQKLTPNEIRLLIKALSVSPRIVFRAMIRGASKHLIDLLLLANTLQLLNRRAG